MASARPEGLLLPGPRAQPRPSQPPPPAARRMMQEQCCHSQLEELHCAAGIHLAGEPDGCASPAAAPHRGNASLEALFVKVSVRPPAGRPRPLPAQQPPSLSGGPRGLSALHPSSRPPFL